MKRSMRLAFVLLGVVASLALSFAMFGGPQILSFRPLESVADLTQRLTPLFVIALFIERALEVFVAASRGPEEHVKKAMRKTKLGAITPEEVAHLVAFKAETRRITLSAGIVLGIVVSAIGIRGLALFISPEQIAGLVGWQRPLLTGVDVLVTGAVLGGGADGIHKIVNVFTTFLDTASANNESRRPADSPRI